MQKKGMDELDRLDAEKSRKSRGDRLVIVLENIRSAMNVGSVFRTADALGISRIVLCGITAKPPDKEIHKTALGATESVPWEYHQKTGEVLNALKNSGYRILAVEQVHGSMALDAFHPKANEKLALVFGNELNGISEETLALCEQAIEIPQSGMKHSLNVSVSAGIVCWDLLQKMKS